MAPSQPTVSTTVPPIPPCRILTQSCPAVKSGEMEMSQNASVAFARQTAKCPLAARMVPGLNAWKNPLNSRV